MARVIIESVLQDMCYRLERRPNLDTFKEYLKLETVEFKTRNDEFDY